MINNDEPTGRAKGGVARADKLTPEKRSEIAKKAAIARWGASPIQVIRKGNFKDDFGIDVDCYVLDDEAKTAVISQRGMSLVLGLSEGGGRIQRLIDSKIMSKFIGPELREKLENPLIFQSSIAAKNTPVTANTHGFDVTNLIDLCNAIIKADSEGALSTRYDNIGKQAQIVLNASAKAGIKGLVYALTGYDQTKEQIITAFKLFVQEEAQKYESEFPSQLYDEWYRLYGLAKPKRNRPWKFMHLTNGHVYFPLANSSGKLHELVVMQRAKKKEDRSKRLFQFLSEIGVKALRTHLGQLLGIAKISKTQAEYEGHVQNVFGAQKNLDI